MKSHEAVEFLNDFENKFKNIRVVIPIPEGPLPEDVEQAVQDIQKAGYSAYIETTVIGDQIVVTDKSDECVRPTWKET